MRQAEIQVGGVYVSKGLGMKQGEVVKIIRIIPQAEGPARVEVQRVSGKGRTTKPLVTSFRGNYEVQSLPHLVTPNLMRPGAQRSEPSQVIYSKDFDITDPLERLYTALSAALDAVKEIRKRVV